MGLDFVQSKARWSYGGFHSFRCHLALEIGITLDEMQGFGGGFKDMPPGERSWSEVNDPIAPFLDHPDNEGELTPQECEQVALRLRELVALWPDDYDKCNALMLAESMDECALNGEALVYC